MPPQWRVRDNAFLRTTMLDKLASPLNASAAVPMPSTLPGAALGYTVTLKNPSTGQETQYPQVVTEPLDRVEVYFPTSNLKGVIYAPSINEVSQCTEYKETGLEVWVVHHADHMEMSVDLLTAFMYTPWLPTERGPDDSMTQHDVQHHHALAYMAEAENWKHAQTSEGKKVQHKLSAQWVSPKPELNMGDESIRSVLSLLPFLYTPTSVMQYMIHPVTQRIYWVDIHGLAGWRVLLQVNCCAPEDALLAEAAPHSQNSTPFKRSNEVLPPRSLRVRLAGAVRKAAALCVGLTDETATELGLGEIQEELNTIERQITRTTLIQEGNRLLLQGQEPNELLRHLVQMFAGLLQELNEKSVGDIKHKYRNAPAGQRLPTEQQVELWKPPFLHKCQNVEPRNWWHNVPYPSKEALAHHLLTSPQTCCKILVPSLEEVLKQATAEDLQAMRARKVGVDNWQAVALAMLEDRL